jgi:hypothetical protein
VRNNERYLAFPPAVPQAFLEKTDLRTQFGTVLVLDLLVLDLRATAVDLNLVLQLYSCIPALACHVMCKITHEALLYGILVRMPVHKG